MTTVSSIAPLPCGWSEARFSDVLSRVDRRFVIDDSSVYLCIGVRWYGQGAFVRERQLGMEIARKQQWIIRRGDVVYNKLFAWKGAFAIAGDDVDGCIVSDKFPTYEADRNKIDLEYLRYYFLTPALAWQAEAMSKGAAAISKLTLNPPQFWELTIPLPSLAEQRRIVERIETLAVKIHEARELRQHIARDLIQLLQVMAHRMDLSAEAKRDLGWREVRIGDVVNRIEDANHVAVENAYPNLGVYSFGRGVFEKQPIRGAATSAKTLYRVKAGQLVYSRLFAFEGAYAIVPEEFDGYFVSNEFPTFECDLTQVTPEFFSAYFKSPSVWTEIAAGSRGMGNRRQRVHPEQLVSHRLMLPPLDWQYRIRDVLNKTTSIERLQIETTPEMDAVLLAVLDRAFKGEL